MSQRHLAGLTLRCPLAAKIKQILIPWDANKRQGSKKDLLLLPADSFLWTSINRFLDLVLGASALVNHLSFLCFFIQSEAVFRNRRACAASGASLFVDDNCLCHCLSFPSFVRDLKAILYAVSFTSSRLPSQPLLMYYERSIGGALSQASILPDPRSVLKGRTMNANLLDSPYFGRL